MGHLRIYPTEGRFFPFALSKLVQISFEIKTKDILTIILQFNSTIKLSDLISLMSTMPGSNK